MTRLVKYVSGFAILGFVIGAVLAVSAFIHSGLIHNYGRICVLFCPPLLLSLHAQSSTGAAAFIWLIICIANATLYGLVGLFFGLLFGENSTAQK